MVSVRLEVLPGLSESVGGKGVDSVFFDKEIEEGSTVGDVVRKIAAEHPPFGDIILDIQAKRLSSGVVGLLNDLLLEALDGLDTRINDGDLIRLVPLIGGG